MKKLKGFSRSERSQGFSKQWRYTREEEIAILGWEPQRDEVGILNAITGNRSGESWFRDALRLRLRKGPGVQRKQPWSSWTEMEREPEKQHHGLCHSPSLWNLSLSSRKVGRRVVNQWFRGWELLSSISSARDASFLIGEHIQHHCGSWHCQLRQLPPCTVICDEASSSRKSERSCGG